MDGKNLTTAYLPSSSGFFIGIVVFICLCIIIGILGNVGVIAYNIFMNHSKTPTTYLVVNLAISDVVVCLTFFPPWLVQIISSLINAEVELVSICRIGMVSSTTSIALSIANLLAITVDRYIFISKPLKYSSVMTWKRTYILLVVIWFLTIVNATLVFFSVEEVKEEIQNFCQLRDPGRSILSFTSFYMPMLGIFYFNYKIFKVAKRQRRKIRHESCTTSYASSQCTGESGNTERKNRMKQTKLVKTFAIVLGVFLCCSIPLLIISLINRSICKRLCVPYSVSWIAGMLAGANSAMNPFIYSLRSREYRIAYRQFFARFCRKT